MEAWYIVGLFPLMLLGLLFFVFWLLMLIDSVKRKYKQDNDKIIWVLVIIFTGIIGSLIYHFVVYKNEDSLKWFWITALILFVIWVLLMVLGLFVA